MANDSLGLLLLGVAALLATGVIYGSTARRAVTRDSFLVANWKIPLWLGAITIAANWAQAPALLFSGQQAYTSTFHFFSFWIPNVVALLVAALLVVNIREQLPKGYNLPQFMGSVFGGQVGWLSFVLAFATIVVAVGYTLVGMRLWLSPQLGLPAWQIALLLGGSAIAWVFRSGTTGAVAGDRVKLTVIGTGVFGVIALWFYWRSGVPSVPNAKPSEIPTGSWWTVWVVGIPLAASLIGGPICNCDLGERFFAVEQSVTRRAYLIAAGIFGTIVLCFGSLGFLARDIGLPIGNDLVAFKLLQASLMPVEILVVTAGLGIVLATALASFIASASNLLTVGLFDRMRPEATVRQSMVVSRLIMIIPILFGTFLASQEQINIGTLLSALAVVRGEMIIPIVIAAFWPTLFPGRHVLIGMYTGLVGGVALTYGAMISKNFFNTSLPFLEYNGAPLGAIFAVASPLVICLLGTLSSKHVNVRSV